jgi:kanamycin kinase/aminoglycoside 3'-phosphotransferase-2
MNVPIKLPQSVSDFVTGYTWNEVTIGKSSAKTYRLQRRHHPTIFLKVDQKWPRRELLEEKRVLEWLSGKLPVATVLLFDEDDNNDYLLISEIPGVDAANTVGSMRNAELVSLLAKGLRMVHRVPVDDCPFERNLDRMVETAGFNVKHKLVHEWDFAETRRGKTAEELYEELLRLRPADEDLVFTHGDYCLPNIIIHRHEIGGFIDLHRAGIADRYQDIALAIRSIGSNIGTGYEQLFLEKYGISEPDIEKIEYYMLLDEFF